MNTKLTKKEFEDFKVRFGIEVSKRALSCEELANDTEAKNFVLNYVKENFLNKETSNLIQNITYKFANMIIDKYAKSEDVASVEFPVVNKYIGRVLCGSYFFAKEDGVIKEVFIEVIKTPIVL